MTDALLNPCPVIIKDGLDGLYLDLAPSDTRGLVDLDNCLSVELWGKLKGKLWSLFLLNIPCNCIFKGQGQAVISWRKKWNMMVYTYSTEILRLEHWGPYPVH